MRNKKQGAQACICMKRFEEAAGRAAVRKSGVEGNVMHVISTIGHSGFAQNPLPANKGVKVSCWVYVVRGGMTIGVINSGNNGYQKTASSTTTCKWEQLSFKCDKPIDNITIYSK